MSKDRVVTPVVDRLTIAQRQHLLACVLSHKYLFSTARIRLKLEYFTDAHEIYLRVLWTVAQQLAESMGVDFLFQEDRTKVWNVLDTECRTYFSNHVSTCPLTQWDMLVGIDPPGFLTQLYQNCKASEFTVEFGLKLLSDFLRERAVNDLWQRLSVSAGSGVVTNLSPMLEQLRTAEAEVSSINVDPVASAAPEGWLPPEVRRRPTGIVWLDKFLRGGHAAPETYGLLGAFGSGKTTLSLQLATSVAANEQFWTGDPEARKLLGLDPDAPYQMGHVYYFHYEMPQADIRKKLWSGAAFIDYDRIERLGSKDFSLSSANNLSKEEKAMYEMICKQNFSVKLGDFPGEQERLELALQMMRVNLHIVDCTGNGATPAVGTGYIPEIATILTNEVRKGRRVALVVIDYAGACVDRFTTDKDQGYHYLSVFGRRCEHEIGVPFDTPVWVMHQLAGAENARTAATKQHHANASGSKRFGENMWFCFNIGTADDKTGCRYFTCSKARRSDLGTSPVLQIAGPYNRLIDVSHQYSFDSHGKVRQNTDMHTVAGKSHHSVAPSKSIETANSATIQPPN